MDGMLEVAKTKTAKKVNGNAPSHLLRGLCSRQNSRLTKR